MTIDPSRVTYIEEGTETLAQRLEACRALALVAANSDIEHDAIVADALEDSSSKYEHRGDRIIEDSEHAVVRGDTARDALVMEVEELSLLGLMDHVILTIGKGH